MGKLWSLIQEWRDGMQYPPSNRQIALDIGVAPTTFSGWRDGLSELPKRHNVWELHRVTNIPFDSLMQAAIDDANLLDPERARAASAARKKSAGAEVIEGNFGGPDPTDLIGKIPADAPGQISEGQRLRAQQDEDDPK